MLQILEKHCPCHFGHFSNDQSLGQIFNIHNSRKRGLFWHMDAVQAWLVPTQKWQSGKTHTEKLLSS